MKIVKLDSMTGGATKIGRASSFCASGGACKTIAPSITAGACNIGGASEIRIESAQ